MIRAHLAEGNVVEAVRQFAACRRVLREQLGVEPSTALAALVGAPPPPAVAVPLSADGRWEGHEGAGRRPGKSA
ncbi:BTAD domain-containing putative transcriptional regulator [Kitasatospora sp. NPDC054939]